MLKTIFLCWAVLAIVGAIAVFVEFVAVAMDETKGEKWRYFRKNIWAAFVIATIVAITAPVSVPVMICTMLDEGGKR